MRSGRSAQLRNNYISQPRTQQKRTQQKRTQQKEPPKNEETLFSNTLLIENHQRRNLEREGCTDGTDNRIIRIKPWTIILTRIRNPNDPRRNGNAIVNLILVEAFKM
jgi:hypothetical protein